MPIVKIRRLGGPVNWLKEMSGTGFAPRATKIESLQVVEVESEVAELWLAREPTLWEIVDERAAKAASKKE
jgi:hypothetical protein